MIKLRDQRISYASIDGRIFWGLMRQLQISLTELNKLYEFDNPPHFRFSVSIPPSYAILRANAMNACSKLVDHFNDVSYLNLVGDHCNWYTADKLHLIRIAQSDLSGHMWKMARLYDTTSETYEGKFPDNVPGYRKPKDFLNYDYEELKRKLMLFYSILGAVSPYIRPNSY